MTDLSTIWSSLFSSGVGDVEWMTDQSEMERFRLSAIALSRAMQGGVDEEYEKEWQEMLRFVNVCRECREKLRSGAGRDELDARCSEQAARWETRPELKSDTGTS